MLIVLRLTRVVTRSKVQSSVALFVVISNHVLFLHTATISAATATYDPIGTLTTGVVGMSVGVGIVVDFTVGLVTEVSIGVAFLTSVLVEMLNVGAGDGVAFGMGIVVVMVITLEPFISRIIFSNLGVGVGMI